MELDIATRIVRAEEDIYVLRPGEEYTLYDDFVRKSHAFLDFPGIGIKRSELPPEDDLRAMITRSLAVKEWHDAGGMGRHPPEDIEQHRSAAKGKRLSKYAGSINRLYYEMPVGTIIVVPGPGYISDVLVGELVGPTANIRIPRYVKEDIPARRVQWVGSKRKGQLSPELIEVLNYRTALFQLPRSLRGEVLSVAYDQYILGDRFTSRIRTTNDDFSTLDDYDIQTFINYVAGVLAAEPSNSKKSPKLGILDAIELLRSHREAIPEFKSNINSKGSLRFFGSDTIPIAIIVLLSAALSGEVVHADTVRIVNSLAPPDDACTLKVEAQVKGAIQMMRIDDWQKVCSQATAANAEAGLRTSVRVTKKNA